MEGKMDEKIKISILLEIYGNLLTDTQKKYMELYYNQDLSLTEIGEIEDITRQAVRTILLKSKNKLYEYEEKLNFMQKELEIKNTINRLSQTKLAKKEQELINKINNELDF